MSAIVSASSPSVSSVSSSTVSSFQVLLLAWPIMVSKLTYTAIAVVDTLVVSELGTAALAGVGLAVPAGHLALSFGVSLARALQVVTAQALGAGRPVAALAWHAVWLAGLIGVPTAVIAALGGPFFVLLTGDVAIAAQASAAFSGRVLGAPLVILSMGLAAWFQGRGDTRTPMVGMLGAAALNVVLDPLLVLGIGPWAGLGLFGTGLAFVMGQAAAALWLSVQAWRQVRHAPRNLDPSLLSEVGRIGVPNAVNAILSVGAFLVFAAMVSRSGEAELAAHVLVLRISSVSFLPGDAVGEATGVMVGHAVGSANAERARQSFAAGLRLGVGIMSAWALLFVVMPGAMLTIFQPAPEVAAVAGPLLLIAAAFQVFDAVAMVSHGALDGAGDARFLMVVEVLSAWLVKLPLGAWLTLGLDGGAAGAWGGLTIEIVVVAALLLARTRGERWLVRIATPEPERAAV